MARTPGRAALSLVLFTAACAALEARQLPPPPPPPPPSAPQLGPPPTTPAPKGTGLLLGQVLDATSGKPIPGVTISLTTTVDRAAVLAGVGLAPAPEDTLERLMSGLLPTASATMPVITDGEGRFLFRDLPKGTHNLRATKSGYVPTSFGQRSPEHPGRPIKLDDGEKRVDVVLRMWKLASLGGTILDEAGEPVVDMAVRAYRRAWSGGRQRLMQSGTSATDDRGRYRISTLTPGDYVVVVPSTITAVPLAAVEAYAQAVAKGSTTELSRQRSESRAPIPFGGGVRAEGMQILLRESIGFIPAAGQARIHIYPTVFYPAGAGSRDATPIRLQSGDDRGGVDFRLQPAPTVRVAGVVSAPGDVAANLGVRLVPALDGDLASDIGLEAAVTATDAEGRFLFPAVAAGHYVLKAYRVPRQVMQTIASSGGMFVSASTSAPASDAPSYYAQTAVTVGNVDVDGIALTFRPGARVSGRVEFRGTAPPPPAARIGQLAVTLAPLDGGIGVPTPAARAGADGRFTTNGYPPGQYTMNVISPGAPWTLESIVVEGVNVLERPLEIGDADIAGAVVTFTDRTTEVTGTVSGIGPKDGDITVMAFPAAHASSPVLARRVVTTAADARGAYRLRITVPGEYFVVAVPPSLAIDNSPDMFAALERLAVRVTIASGDQKSQPLTLGTVR